jgi:hypothetical protein
MMKKNLTIPLIILSLAFSVFSSQDNIANAAQVIESILTNQNPDNYECGGDILPPAVSVFDASKDYAVYLYLILGNVKVGDTEKIIAYYEGNAYGGLPTRTFTEAADYLCTYWGIIIKGTNTQCKTGNFEFEYYLNEQKVVTKTFYLQGISCGGGSCIAEAVLENDEDSLNVLREFRDKVLSNSIKGKKLVALYYEYSPMAVKFIEDKPEVKSRLNQIIKTLIPTIKKML